MARGLFPSSLFALTLLTLIAPLSHAASAEPASVGPTPTPAAVVRLEGKIDDYTRDAAIAPGPIATVKVPGSATSVMLVS